MKFLKNILLTMTVLTVGLMNAKQAGIKTVPVKTELPRVTTAPLVQPEKQSVMQQQSYAHALNVIRNQMRPGQVLHNNQFTDNFVNFVKDSVKNNGENAAVLAKALLQAGAYLYTEFMNEDVINFTIITDLNDEINRQMQAMHFGAQQLQPIIPEPIIKKEKIVKSKMYLVPTDAHTLRKFDLCPLFERKTVALNQEEKQLADTLAKQGHSEESIMQFLGKVAPHYYIFNENYKLESGEVGLGFDSKNIGFDAPCVVPLGKFNNWNRTLLQLKSLDQLELADTTGLPAALCAGHSLNNGRLIRQYALTGNTQFLKDLHNINDSANFLRDNRFGEWLYAKDVRKSIAQLRQDLGVDGIDISAISSVSLFDSNLDQKIFFEAIFDKNEFDYVQKVKKNIQAGLRQENYVHIIIIGNEETVGGQGSTGLGHYFCFAIIKVGNEIQYIVLDTISSTYHLQAGSHERNQLMFIIENIEGGKISTMVPNIQVKLYENIIKK